jgi:hypothetical protein
VGFNLQIAIAHESILGNYLGFTKYSSKIIGLLPSPVLADGLLGLFEVSLHRPRVFQSNSKVGHHNKDRTLFQSEESKCKMLV